MLAFCYSINGDVAMLLRACGLFSKMIINHDLKIITRNPRVWLNPIQEELLTKIGIRFYFFFHKSLGLRSEGFLIDIYLFQPAMILRSAPSFGAGLGRARQLLLWRFSKLNSVTSKQKTNQSK